MLISLLQWNQVRENEKHLITDKFRSISTCEFSQFFLSLMINFNDLCRFDHDEYCENENMNVLIII